MMKLELTVWDRVQLLGLVRAQRGDVGLIVDMMALVKVLELSDKEKGAIGLVQEKEGTFWKTEGTYMVEFTKAQMGTLKKLVSNHLDWPVDERVPALAQKIEEA